MLVSSHIFLSLAIVEGLGPWNHHTFFCLIEKKLVILLVILPIAIARGEIFETLHKPRPVPTRDPIQTYFAMGCTWRGTNKIQYSSERVVSVPWSL